ncbi:MAG: hypothetical protein QNK37_29975 [Acidobacteriota bacterium]|nr:hypothetical protein [Acidobacteriota bacterium]
MSNSSQGTPLSQERLTEIKQHLSGGSLTQADRDDLLNSWTWLEKATEQWRSDWSGSGGSGSSGSGSSW